MWLAKYVLWYGNPGLTPAALAGEKPGLPAPSGSLSLLCRCARASYIARLTVFQRTYLQNLSKFLIYKVFALEICKG